MLRAVFVLTAVTELFREDKTYFELLLLHFSPSWPGLRDN